MAPNGVVIILPRRRVKFAVFPPLLRYVATVIVTDAVAVADIVVAGLAFVGFAVVAVAVVPVAVAVVEVLAVVACVGLAAPMRLYCWAGLANRCSALILNWLGRSLAVGRHALWNRTDRTDLWCCYPNRANSLGTCCGAGRPRDKANNNETLCQSESNVGLFVAHTLNGGKKLCAHNNRKQYQQQVERKWLNFVW